MDFELSEDQVLLQESVTRFVADNYSFEQRRKLVDTDQGYSDKQWSQFAELGWLGMPFAEDVGGYGGTPVETMVVLEEFGKGLVAEPYISTIVLGGGALAGDGWEGRRGGCDGRRLHRTAPGRRGRWGIARIVSCLATC